MNKKTIIDENNSTPKPPSLINLVNELPKRKHVEIMRRPKTPIVVIKINIQNCIKTNLLKLKNIFIGLRQKVRASYALCKPNKG